MTARLLARLALLPALCGLLAWGTATGCADESCRAGDASGLKRCTGTLTGLSADCQANELCVLDAPDAGVTRCFVKCAGPCPTGTVCTGTAVGGCGDGGIGGGGLDDEDGGLLGGDGGVPCRTEFLCRPAVCE